MQSHNAAFQIGKRKDCLVSFRAQKGFWKAVLRRASKIAVLLLATVTIFLAVIQHMTPLKRQVIKNVTEQKSDSANTKIYSRPNLLQCSYQSGTCKKLMEPHLESELNPLPVGFNSDMLANVAPASCTPKSVRVACLPTPVHEFASRFACTKDMFIEEYDYDSQYSCLLQISRQVQAAHKGGNSTRVPLIGHAIFYYAGRAMKFNQALSIISLIRYLKPAVYFFWNDQLPQGRWWSELVSRIQHRNYAESIGVNNAPENYFVRFISVRRTKPAKIYGRPFLFAAHPSDLVRLQAAISFGGVYLDFDAFAVNDLSPLLHSPFVLGYEKWGLLNNGVMFSERQADFAILWHCQYAFDYDPTAWIDHSVLRSHELAEACPHLIRRENSSLNQPNNFGNIHLLFGDDVYFNLSNNYVVHSWLWQYKVELNEKVILGLRHTMGRIWRSLYYVQPLEA